jgi:chromosome segregation ATPase
MAKKEKPKKGEFEKMGDLEKGVSEKKEDTEDIIKEIESFDATKDKRPPEKGDAETPEGEKTAGEPEKKKPVVKEEKATVDEGEKLKKELEREREKTKSLAKIIEKVSSAADKPKEKPVEKPAAPDVEPKIKEIESKINERIEAQMKEVKDAVAAIGTKAEEAAKSGKSERVGTKVKDMVDKVQADTTKKIAEMEETITKMIEKIESPEKREDVSKGLAAFGGSVDLKNKILELRSSIQDLNKGLNELRDETDTRITRIKEQVKVLEKIPAIEEKVEGLIERMSPANIEKLKKFIFSADEITGEIIPNEVEKKVTKDLTPVFNDMKDVRDDIEKLSENIKTLFNEINFFKGELKNLYKLGDYISDLQAEKETMKKKVDDKETNLLKMVSKLEDLIKKNENLLYEKLGEFEKVFTGRVEIKVKEFFDDLTESKFLELEDRTEKNLAVSRAKVNDMVSKFVQFQNVVNPTLSLIKEEMEKLNTKLDKLKESQADLEEETDEHVKEMFSNVAEPRINELKEIMAKFTETVDSRLNDFESEFVQFQNVINPTLNLLKNDISKVDNKVEKIKTKYDELKGNVKDLEGLRKSIDSIKEGMTSLGNKQNDLDKSILILGNKLGEIKEEFKNVVKQSLIDKKKLDEESKKEKERINILLKELKGS